ncbi:MAG: VWA domain-containing protein [Thermoleophilia bacterium]|nr:VWA domain-containing protein [Gaiellaceae bacterium]MDW8338005.1 VWA domain-containing protein [Thermoleophilia bacterium]
MRVGARIGAACLALCLAAPAAALGQGGAPTLREERSSSFPDKTFILELPERKALRLSDLVVTENGADVLSPSLEAPGKTTGAILLIDASNSMKGAPIAGAMEAARAFLEVRSPDLPVAVLAYNPEVTVLSGFTTDGSTLEAAVAKTPPTREGTHIYDALIEAAELVEAEGLPRATAVLLSDGHRRGVQASLEEALAALSEANVRVLSVGLRSPDYDEATLKTLAERTGGTYVVSPTPRALEPIYADISAQLSNEYILRYRSLLPAQTRATVKVSIPGLPPASATYVTPAIALQPGGTFEQSWIDRVILSPWLMLFVVVAVVALLGFALLSLVEAQRRSLRRRMAAYVSVPSEEESRARRAEVAALLAETAQRRVAGRRWWQRFESDVELAGFRLSALALAGWTIVGGIAASLLAAVLLESFWGLLVGLAAPFVTRFLVSRRVRKTQEAFAEQLPDNLDVLAGALRTGHATMGALAVMVDSAAEPSRSEFRRVLQDEQLGVPLEDALMVMARRMQSPDAEQVAIVMGLQREAGGNTAEVLDRVAETIRGRMELRRLVRVLTAQARISRWILTALPIVVFALLVVTGGDYLDPMLGSLAGRVALVVGAVMVILGSIWIKKIAELDV